MSSRQDIIIKIQKLRSLAKSTQFPGERDVANASANKLIKDNNITEAEISGTSSTSPKRKVKYTFHIYETGTKVTVTVDEYTGPESGRNAWLAQVANQARHYALKKAAEQHAKQKKEKPKKYNPVYKKYYNNETFSDNFNVGFDDNDEYVYNDNYSYFDSMDDMEVKDFRKKVNEGSITLEEMERIYKQYTNYANDNKRHKSFMDDLISFIAKNQKK